MLDFAEAIEQLNELSGSAESLRAAFKSMATSVQKEGSFFNDSPGLTVNLDEENWWIDVSHFGTTIRFQLFLALDTQGPIGRVICLHCYSFSGETAGRPLGALIFDTTGSTSLGKDERGRAIRLGSHGNLIVAYFLHKAHLANKSISPD